MTVRRLLVTAALGCALGGAACGDEPGGLDAAVLADAGASDTGPGAADTGAVDAGAGGSDGGGADGGGADGGGADMGSTDGGAGENSAFRAAGENPGQWTWVPVPGAKCRDGSDTGFLVRLQPGATRLVMYLQGGGACFNQFTCQGNPSRFGEANAMSAQSALTRGIFDDASADNPVADWNMAFIPYCTGDVFAGTREDVTVPGVPSPQQFVGAMNMRLFTDLIAEQLSSTTEVLLTGSSAGGFGAALSFDQVATRWAPVPVHLLDDSGQPLENGGRTVATCLTQLWFDLWGIQPPSGCTNCGPDAAGFRGLAQYLSATYPDSNLALATYLEDQVIRSFLLFGVNNCMPTSPNPVPAADFRADLLDLRTSLPGWGTFYVTGTEHTFLGSDARYQTLEVGGLSLADYLEALLSDDVRDVGP